MKTFEYTIKDELGIHARPAGLLVKEAKKYESECTITKDGKTKKLTQLMMLMSLGVKQGETVTVTAEGADEDTAIELAKKEWGINVDAYIFEAEKNSDGTFEVTVRNQNDRNVVTVYQVNVKTGAVTE